MASFSYQALTGRSAESVCSTSPLGSWRLAQSRPRTCDPTVALVTSGYVAPSNGRQEINCPPGQMLIEGARTLGPLPPVPQNRCMFVRVNNRIALTSSSRAVESFLA